MLRNREIKQPNLRKCTVKQWWCMPANIKSDSDLKSTALTIPCFAWASVIGLPPRSSLRVSFNQSLTLVQALSLNCSLLSHRPNLPKCLLHTAVRSCGWNLKLSLCLTESPPSPPDSPLLCVFSPSCSCVSSRDSHEDLLCVCSVLYRGHTSKWTALWFSLLVSSTPSL